MADKNKAPESGGFQRIEDFYTDYSNSVFLESSFWDLKLIFGQLDQSTSPPTTEQRTAVTIPWTQAKIFNYLLTAHLFAHEMANGPIVIPPAVTPPEIAPPTEEAKKADPNLQRLYDEMVKLRQQFFGVRPSK